MGRVTLFSTSALLMGLALTVAPVAATEIKFPKDKPRVAFDVPDGWAVTYTADGLELRSPEKNCFVVASFMKRTRPIVDAWTKQANQTMMTEGVTFDKTAKAPAPKVATAPAGVATPATIAAAPLNPFTLSGEPAPEMKTAPPSEIQPQTGPVVTMPESFGGVAQADRPKIPFKVVQYYGASFAGKPVDVQLVIFKVNPEDLFLMEQASNSDDNRAVGIITSVKPAK